MLSFISNTARRFGKSILAALGFLAAHFPHHPLDSSLTAKVKSLYLIPTAIVLIPLMLALSLVKHTWNFVFQTVVHLIGFTIGALLNYAEALYAAAARAVVGLPSFAWELWTHKPMHPFDYLLAAVMRGARR